MTRERTALLEHLNAERQHVLAAVEGLSEQSMTSASAPSGWSIAQLLNHLTYDDEIFWAGAILGGDKEHRPDSRWVEGAGGLGSESRGELSPLVQAQ